nr:sulfatase-like hydrolase/transferase [Saprospiraceae bacterium]
MKQSSHVAKLQVFPFVFFLPFFISFSTAAQTPPNVLFILADDLAWGDLHCHGNDSVSTPNLDRLAEASVQF